MMLTEKGNSLDHTTGVFFFTYRCIKVLDLVRSLPSEFLNSGRATELKILVIDSNSAP